MASERIEYSKRERNIPKELHEAWQRLRSKKDVAALMQLTGKSKPVISAALKNGYVSNPGLAERITEYYNARPAEIKLSKKARQLIEKTNQPPAES